MQFQDQLRIMQTVFKILFSYQPAIALVSMTGGMERVSWGSSSSNSISSGVKTCNLKRSMIFWKIPRKILIIGFFCHHFSFPLFLRFLILYYINNYCYSMSSPTRWVGTAGLGLNKCIINKEIMTILILIVFSHD